jgi:hypothetical protein
MATYSALANFGSNSSELKASNGANICVWTQTAAQSLGSSTQLILKILWWLWCLFRLVYLYISIYVKFQIIYCTCGKIKCANGWKDVTCVCVEFYTEVSAFLYLIRFNPYILVFYTHVVISISILWRDKQFWVKVYWILWIYMLVW